MTSSKRKGAHFPLVAIPALKRHAAQERGEKEHFLSGLASKPVLKALLLAHGSKSGMLQRNSYGSPGHCSIITCCPSTQPP